MTLNELIERLEEYRDLHGEDCEVRLMTQQNWPFENAITGLVSGAEINDTDDEDDEDVEEEDDSEIECEDCGGSFEQIHGEQKCESCQEEADEKEED